MFKCLNEKGFTLIETLVVIFIFTLTMGAVSGLILMTYRIHGYTWEQSMAIDEVRRGVETMVKEIREARSGDDGSYAIEKAGDKEFIFYSDIDKDGATERVRFFLGTVSSGNQIKKCVTFAKGGTCSVIFSNFLSGTLNSAQLKVSVEGDFGWSKEYAEIFADGTKIGEICKTGCLDCPGTWQGTQTFDVTSQASDGSITFEADASSYVDHFCNWEKPNHSMKANFEFSWTESLTTGQNELKKGVINPTSSPISYPLDQEEVAILGSYVRNTPPIFNYFDENGEPITGLPARLRNTKVIGVYLVVDVNPDRPPPEFELRSAVQLRNLKNE